MKIKRLNEAIESKNVAESINEIIKPWINKLQIEDFVSDHYTTISPSSMAKASFRIWKALDNETFEDYKDLLGTFNKFGLVWYYDNDTCYVELNKYNDEMKTYIDAKKYNL